MNTSEAYTRLHTRLHSGLNIGAKRPSRLRTAAYFFPVLLMTMVSIYSPALGEYLVYLGLVAFLSFLLLNKVKVLDVASLRFMAFLLALLCVGVGMSFFRTVALVDIRSAAATAVMIACIPFMYSLVKGNKELTVHVLDLVIVLQSALLLAQVGYWLITRQYLDLFHMIGGGESRSFSSFSFEISGSPVPRFTGLFVEPGTFSVVTMSLATAIYAYRRKFTLPIVVGMIAVLCTMSLFGVTMILLLGAIHFVQNKRRFIYALAGFAVLVVGFYLVGGYAIILDRWHASNGGFGFRRDMLTLLFSSVHNMALGVSISDYPGFVTANDIGVWFAFWLSFGIAGAAEVLAVLSFGFNRTKSLVAVGLVVIVMLTKLKFTYPLFWFLVVCIIVFSARQGRLHLRPQAVRYGQGG